MFFLCVWISVVVCCVLCVLVLMVLMVGDLCVDFDLNLVGGEFVVVLLFHYFCCMLSVVIFWMIGGWGYGCWCCWMCWCWNVGGEVFYFWLYCVYILFIYFRLAFVICNCVGRMQSLYIGKYWINVLKIIPAAARFFSLDASSCILATQSYGAGTFCSPLWAQLVWCECMIWIWI